MSWSNSMVSLLPQIQYDPAGAFLPGMPLPRSEFDALVPRLDAARAEVLADLDLWNRSQAGAVAIPHPKQPLDAAFIDLPERLLAEYRSQRQRSEVGRIVAAARRLMEAVDRVVLLGIGGSYMGARALFEACCHPYHNELSRHERGERPRIYFEGNNVDNDALAGLLDLLGTSPADDPAGRWGLVVISKSGSTLETAIAFRKCLEALRSSTGGDQTVLKQRLLGITGTTGKLNVLLAALGCEEVFRIPHGVGGRFSVLTAVGLLPAAIMGLDVVRLLEGAAAMNDRFRTAPVGRNPVLDYVGVCHLHEERAGLTTRVLSVWAKGLEAAGLWYDQLLSESLGKQGRGALPLTVVNTRDLHSRGQQHQEGRRDKLITNLVVGQVRRDRLHVGRSDLDQDGLNTLAEKSLPDIMAAAIQGTNQAYQQDQRPTADLLLPRLDEPTLGQFFQMMMLATVVEGRFIGINPYGQPGVEAYKRNMQAILKS
jgi:glucose-6-phosphate isomerase